MGVFAEQSQHRQREIPDQTVLYFLQMPVSEKTTQLLSQDTTLGFTEAPPLRDIASEDLPKGHSHVFDSLFHWLGGATVIVDRERIIVAANDEFARLAGVDDREEVCGKRVGEALHCVYEKKGQDGCGSSTSCQFCGAFKSMVSSFSEESGRVQKECRLFLAQGAYQQSLKFRVRAERAPHPDQEYSAISFHPPGPVSEFGVDTPLSREATASMESVDAYLTLRKVGTGGMGSVYLVRDSEGQEYVLKTLREEIASLPEIEARFQREAHIAVLLNHPNIVKTYKTGKTPAGVIYLIAEYCPEGSTSEWLQRNGLIPAETAVKWMRDAASALNYLWNEHGTIHRDIKPDNLLLDRQGHIKVTDFGIAKHSPEIEGEITHAGDIIGTVRYLAPEQAAGDEKIDIRADLYGLGATFFELLSGNAPFDGMEADKMLTEKLLGNAPSLSAKKPELPLELCHCIDRLLARDPGGRFDSPAHLLKEIDRLANKLQIGISA